MSQRITFALLFCLALLSSAFAFVPSTTSVVARSAITSAATVAPLKAAPIPVEFLTTNVDSSSSLLSLGTLDPTTMLSDILGGLINSNAILAVPIIAALAIAGLIAFLIVSYANPADEDNL